MRPAVRTLFIVTFTVIAVAWAAGDIALPWHPFSTYGFAATQSGVMLGVDPEAASRGLHAGDRVDVASLTPQDRATFGTFPLAPEGRTMRLSLLSGCTVTVQSQLSLLTHRIGSAYALLTMSAATAVPVTS